MSYLCCCWLFLTTLMLFLANCLWLILIGLNGFEKTKMLHTNDRFEDLISLITFKFFIIKSAAYMNDVFTLAGILIPTLEHPFSD